MDPSGTSSIGKPVPSFRTSLMTNHYQQNGTDAVPLSTPQRSAELDFRTPVAPPRAKHEEARRTAERARQDARERARLKSDEDLGLSPEDR